MAITRSQFSQQMVAQLRLLNPNYSAEIGTPERLILDTVAQSLTDSQIDLIGLQNALNIETKFGSNLDNFVGLFGFARQVASAATGFVVFSRNVPSEFPITVPQGTALQSTTPVPDGGLIQFATSASITLAAGQLATQPVPIFAVNPGGRGNVEANTITIMVGEPVFGITAVTNPTATSGGADQEDDNSLKVRFKNTVFRNLSGTEDQFLALAISTAFSTKANVVGPVSQYQEYIQVPKSKDLEAYNYGGGNSYSGKPPHFVTTASGKKGLTTITVPTTSGFESGTEVIIYENGDNPAPATSAATTFTIASPTSITISSPLLVDVKNSVALVGIGTSPKTIQPTEWTTTLSTIPYAKNIWTAKPVFITKNISNLANYFFRQGVDFTFNYPAKFQGDALRAFIDGTGPNSEIPNSLGKSEPNVTFTNVYTGGNEAVQAVRPEEVVLLEYSYTSTSSRNDLEHNVTNAVDVYVDGSNNQPSTVVFAIPTGSVGMTFVENEPNSMYYYENYRRDGEPTKRPLVSNVLTPLLQQPVTSLPKQISILVGGTINNYYLGTHYWLVHDVSEYEGTIRARSGIEWSNNIPGDAESLGPQPEPLTRPPLPNDPSLADPLKYGEGATPGKLFKEIAAGTPVEVQNYTYDKNIPDLQAALENARQITTDTLAHKARSRYFKLDITVIYDPAATPSIVNSNIYTTLSSYLKNQYFGAVINLSNLLQVVHSVPGVNNVRWTNDVPNTSSLIRVYETDTNGLPLLGVSIDRLEAGGGSKKEIHQLFIAGGPTGENANPAEGTTGITMTYFLSGTNKPVHLELAKLQNSPAENASYLEKEIKAQTGGTLVTVTADARPTVGVTHPLESYTITYTTPAAIPLPVINNRLTGGEFVFDGDFFLRDNELPSLPTGMQTASNETLPPDTLPGLIIRPRAQGTWQRAN